METGEREPAEDAAEETQAEETTRGETQGTPRADEAPKAKAAKGAADKPRKKKKRPAAASPATAPAETASAELPGDGAEEETPLPPAAKAASGSDDETATRTLLNRAFLQIDRRVLALFRIWFAGALMYDLLRRAVHTTALFSNQGVLPNHFVHYAPQARPQFSIFLPFSEPDEVRFAFALTALVYVLFGLGFHTRIMSVIAFFCAFSLNTRNLFLEDGGCAAMSIMAAWACFLPLGDRFSIDALRKSVRAELEGRPLSRAETTAPFVSIVVLGIVLEFALIYFFNALHKKGLTWRQGTAVHYVLWQNRLNTPFAVWLRMHEPSFLSPLLSYGTLALEAALPALVLSPYHRVKARTVAVLAAISFHLGIALTMTLGPFSYAMIALDILLLPGEALDWVRDRYLATASGVVLRIRGDEMGPRWVAACYRAISGGTFTIVDDAAAGEEASARFSVRVGEGAETGDDFEAARATIEAALAPPARLVAKLLAPVARAQLAWEEPSVLLPPTRTLDLRWFREGFAAVFIFAMLLQMTMDNPAVPKWLRIAPPGPLKAMNDYPRLIQAWNMFSPDAPTDDGILVVDAVTVSGRHVDPFTNEAPDFERVHHRPVAHSAAMGDYVSNVRGDGNRRFRREFEKYVFEYNTREKLPASERIVSFEAYWVGHDSPKPGSTEPTNLRKELAFSGKR